jgi:hypothetical protein
LAVLCRIRFHAKLVREQRELWMLTLNHSLGEIDEGQIFIKNQAVEASFPPSGSLSETVFLRAMQGGRLVTAIRYRRRLCTREGRNNTATGPSCSEQTVCCKGSCQWS